jgi:ubiquitin carboxyl-terminal hydrolase 25/28
VAALGNLFWELEYAETPAITPDLELAKLALVTSKDEEEDEHGRNDVATDSSASTDATLVDEPVPMGPAPAPAPPSTSPPTPSAMSPSPSVLGKRQRRARSASTMDVDGTGDLDRDGFVMVSKPKSPVGAMNEHRRTLSSASEPKADVEMAGTTQDVDMQDPAVDDKENKPPPLPPRRKTDVNSESVMMFGELPRINPNVCSCDDRQTTRCGRVHGQLHVSNRNCPTSFR